MSLSLKDISERIQKHSELASIDVDQLQKFLRLSARLLPEIRSGVKPHRQQNAPANAALALPETILNFLSAALSLPANTIVLFWIAFGDFVTADLSQIPCISSDDQDLVYHGLRRFSPLNIISLLSCS